MPTHVTPGVPGGPLRQSADCMGNRPGAFMIQRIRLARFSANDPLANVVRLARWVRFGPYVLRLDELVVWQFVHWNFVEKSVPASPAFASGTAGPWRWLASQASKSLGLWTITRKRMLAWLSPQYWEHWPRKMPGVSARSVMWFVWPGTTSVFPASSGTQKEWMTLQPGPLFTP